MCIIVYKPQGAAFPAKKTLQRCFERNSDGAGFMLADGEKVIIKKGYMTFNGFYKALKKARENYGDDAAFVVHFRISTQAGTRADCTHPFPLSADMRDLRRLECSCDVGIAHNGVISLTSAGYYKQVTYSDTMKFITDYLSLIIDSKEYYKDPRKAELIGRLADGSRLAILDGSGHCELIGAGWVEDGGIWYSNGGYKDFKPIIKTTGAPSLVGWSDYDDETDFYDSVEGFYNEDAQVYEFGDTSCPLYRFGDDTFCDMCARYGECFGGL